MAFKNLPGSDTALSLAANPLALPIILTVAGVAVTISAAVWSYHAYSAYQEKKHRKEIEKINDLHKRFLEKIYIHDNNEIQGFPPIFKLAENEKSSMAESMHFTEAEINAIGNAALYNTDVVLYQYREFILNAIQELKSYYLDRHSPHDITAGVLSYLLYILEAKCLNFAGYEYDIAYLNALSGFINAYASLQNTECSQHFSRLSPVRGYLRMAVQALEKHKRELSLKEMISELSNHCVSINKKMIKMFVKLISPEKNWRYISTATHDELSRGILRRKYVHAQVLGVRISSDKAIKIPHSYFRPWLTALLSYFEQSINPESFLTLDDVLSPDQLFILPDLDKLKILRKKSSRHLNQAERKEKADNEKILSSIRHLFHRCENYLTMKLDPQTSYDSPTFTHVTEEEELMARSGMLVDFATLIYQSLSLQFLCVYLLKSIKQLGEIYVKNPQHFSLIFNVLAELCNQIKQSIDTNKESLLTIQQSNHNMMRLEAQELFPEQINELLETVQAIISRLDKRVQDYRDHVLQNQAAIANEKCRVKQEMFSVALFLARIHHLHSADTAVGLPQRDNAMDIKDEINPLPQNAQHPFSETPAIRPQLTFWQKNKYKVLSAILIGCGLFCMLLAIILSLISGGILSPMGAILGAIGIKIGLTGIGLAGADAVFGLLGGLFMGALVDSTVVASSYTKINKQLAIKRSKRLIANQKVFIDTAALNTIKPTPYVEESSSMPLPSSSAAANKVRLT